MTGCYVQVWGGATCTVYAGFGQGQTLGLVAHVHVYCAECEDTVNLHKKVINLNITYQCTFSSYMYIVCCTSVHN